MNPTLQQVLQWVLERKNNPPGESMHEHIANRAAEWSAAQSTERIAALEAANAKQAARIAELEDERERLGKQPAVAYRERITGRLADADDEHRTRFHMAYDALYARPAPARTPDVEWLSNVIREVDGGHMLGAEALAEAIAPRIEARLKGGE